MELLTLQICYCRIAYLVEVMRHYLRVQAYSDTLHSLCQEQWEFHRQRNRFLITSVIGHLPLCRLRIEYRLEGKLTQSCLNITWSSGSGACQDISPVTLCIDEQVFLSHLYQGITNRSITMWVELHSVPDDVCHLIISSVIHAFHRMQDASLNRFQTILYMWHSTLEDYV